MLDDTDYTMLAAINADRNWRESAIASPDGDVMLTALAQFHTRGFQATQIGSPALVSHS